MSSDDISESGTSDAEKAAQELRAIYESCGRLFQTPTELCGIYHLIADGQVVYVGQTTNVLCRIGVHQQQRRICFDSFRFFACSLELLDDQEQLHIEVFSPKHNDKSRRRPGAKLETRLDRIKRELHKLWMARKSLEAKIERRAARRERELRAS